MRGRSGKSGENRRFPAGAARRCRANSGETLIEVLAALLIGVPAMGMIAGAIVTSSGINRQMETQTGQLQKFLPTMEGENGVEGSVSISWTPAEAGADGSFSVMLYNDDGKGIFYYFTNKKKEEAAE